MIPGRGRVRRQKQWIGQVVPLSGTQRFKIQNGRDEDDTIDGNKADPPGSDAGCTGNPHDFSQPTGNPHDPDKLHGNPHECFEFVIPESPIGTAALIMSSLGALGGFVYFGSRKHGSLGPFAHP